MNDWRINEMKLPKRIATLCILWINAKRVTGLGGAGRHNLWSRRFELLLNLPKQGSSCEKISMRRNFELRKRQIKDTHLNDKRCHRL